MVTEIRTDMISSCEVTTSVTELRLLKNTIYYFHGKYYITAKAQMGHNLYFQVQDSKCKNISFQHLKILYTVFKKTH